MSFHQLLRKLKVQVAEGRRTPPRALLGTALLLGFFALTLPSNAGFREGNGGDYIRGMFMQMGLTVLQHLTTTKDGAALAATNKLDLNALKSTLTIDVIKVSQARLYDNGGSEVDAIGTPNSITLNHDAWFDHLENERDVYFLVFHEMLRAVAVNDDNYVISGHVLPFPKSERIATGVVDAVPLIPGDNLSAVLDLSGSAINGSGCPNGYGSFLDFNVETNVVGFRFKNFAIDYAGNQPLSGARRNCIASIRTRSLPANYRLVVSQVDVATEVNLPPYQSFTVDVSPYLVGGYLPTTAEKITLAADTTLAGRSLMRVTDGLLATACGAGPSLLNIPISGRVSAPAPGTIASGRILSVLTYLSLEACGP